MRSVVTAVKQPHQPFAVLRTLRECAEVVGSTCEPNR